MTQYVCEALRKRHDRKPFDCGVPVLNEYLRRFASQDIKRKAAAVFVFTPENDPDRVVGYYTLCSISIELSDLPVDRTKKLPRYPDVPGILIGRLARDLTHPGIGRMLLFNALQRCVRSTDEIAAALVVVDAKDEVAEKFYSKFGFQTVPQLKSRLFLPMQAASKLDME